ncbi:Membrane protease YdiL (CAAX protease family) [Pararobbsia alpina]|uniref:CPBP family intramembrane glutamic endopeptidase n=1 Tax=Pararobbsia alpina TaxID=621374 RepID=UPI0039A54557
MRSTPALSSFTRLLMVLCCVAGVMSNPARAQSQAQSHRDAAPALDLKVDALRAPDKIAGHVSDQEQHSYQQVLDAYAQAQLANPKDSALALAHCRFIEHFTYLEDLSWGDAAGKDLDACRAAVDKQFPDDPEVRLFVLEHRFGADGIAYGTSLIPASKAWAVPQRARLHATLSRLYQFQKNDAKSGEEALAATELDPGSERLPKAMRYLAGRHREADAVKLLKAAPVDTKTWLEGQRIGTALEVLPGSAAADELRRAETAGVKIDAFTKARALQRAGDSAGANAALAAQKINRFESEQNRQLRLDVAFDAHDAATVETTLRETYQQNQAVYPLTWAYAHLIRLNPAAIFRADLFPVALGMLGVLVAYAAMPGLVLFPVHYWGTVRRRAGRVSEPLFDRVGLRHAWYALGVFFVALFGMSMFRIGGASISTTGSGVSRSDWPQIYAVTEVWTLGMQIVLLAGVAWLFGWRDWLGKGKWESEWLIMPIVLCVAYPLRQELFRLPTAGSLDVHAPGVILTQGALALGGVGFAAVLTCVIVPIVEELVYRGFLLGGLTRHLSFEWSNVVQAAVFSAMHREMRYFVYLFALGAVCGWLARKTRGLSMSIAVHGVNNLIFLFGVVRG